MRLSSTRTGPPCGRAARKLEQVREAAERLEYGSTPRPSVATDDRVATAVPETLAFPGAVPFAERHPDRIDLTCFSTLLPASSALACRVRAVSHGGAIGGREDHLPHAVHKYVAPRGSAAELDCVAMHRSRASERFSVALRVRACLSCVGLSHDDLRANSSTHSGFAAWMRSGRKRLDVSRSDRGRDGRADLPLRRAPYRRRRRLALATAVARRHGASELKFATCCLRQRTVMDAEQCMPGMQMNLFRLSSPQYFDNAPDTLSPKHYRPPLLPPHLMREDSSEVIGGRSVFNQC